MDEYIERDAAIEAIDNSLKRVFVHKVGKSIIDKIPAADVRPVVTLPKWIPVTERLPEFEGAVLCMRKSNVYGVRPHQEILYVDEYGFKNYDDIYLADGVVTHWMPLPEPPKEE